MGEYIEREAAIQALGDEPETWYEHDPVEIQEQNDWDYYKHCIEAIPVADVAPVRHGRWIDCSNGWMCSMCERDSIYDTSYCPHCGALMDEAVDMMLERWKEALENA